MHYFPDDLDLDECARAHGLQDDCESDDSDSGKSELDEKYYQNRLEVDEDDYVGNTKLIKADLSRLTLFDSDDDGDDNFQEIGGRRAHKDVKPRNCFPTYAMAVTGHSASTSNRFQALEPSSDEEIADNNMLDSSADVATSVIDAELPTSLQVPVDDEWQTVSYKKSKKFESVSEKSDSNRNMPLIKQLVSKEIAVQQNTSKKLGTHDEQKCTEKQQETHSTQPATGQKKKLVKKQHHVSKKSGIDHKKKQTEKVQQKQCAQPTTNQKKKVTKKQQQKVSDTTGINEKLKQPPNLSYQLVHEKLSHGIDEKKKEGPTENAEAVVGREHNVFLQQQEQQNRKTFEQYDLYTCKQCMDFINNEKERYSEGMFDFFSLEHDFEKELVTRIWARRRIKEEDNRRGSIQKKIRSFLQNICNFFLTLFGRGRHNGICQTEYNFEPLVTLVLSELEACCIPNRYTLRPIIADID